MLQSIRDRLTGRFAKAILVVIFLPFAFFGVTNYNFLSAGWAAKVNGTEISLLQLENAYQNQLLQLSQFGDLPPEYLRTIRSGILERLVRETLVDLHVAESGFYISDEMVAELLQEVPQFQQDGAFNKDLYYAWLDQNALDAQFFEAQQRQSIRNSQLQRGIAATAFVTPSEYRRYLNLFAEQRQVSIATFDVAALADTVVVNDEDVAAYYDSAGAAFMAPESVDFDYIELRRDQLMQEVSVAEEDIVEFYEQSAERFLQDEQRQARHILILFGDDEAAAEQQATELTARVQAGESFADLAQEFSMDGGTAQQGGDLGSFPQSQLPGALGDAIFAMGAGEIRGPVRSEFGFHVIQLDEIVDGGPLPLEQVRAELEAELKTNDVDARFIELERTLANALFDAEDLQALAEISGLDIATASEFTRTGGEPFGTSQAVIEAVFDPEMLAGDRISDVIDIDANRSILVQVRAYREEARQPLEEVADAIRFQLQSERALNMVQDRSRRLIEALQDGENFDAAATEVEAAVTPALIVGRQDETLDGALLNEIFLAKKPQPGKARIAGTMTTAGDYAVFMLTAVIPGRPEAIPVADRDARKSELEQTAGIADYSAYISELERRADIERSEDALQQPEIFQ